MLFMYTIYIHTIYGTYVCKQCIYIYTMYVYSAGTVLCIMPVFYVCILSIYTMYMYCVCVQFIYIMHVDNTNILFMCTTYVCNVYLCTMYIFVYSIWKGQCFSSSKF